MATIKTSKLTGAALDWAVAKCEGREPTYNMESHGRVWRGWWLRRGGEYETLPHYSADWSKGGPIIERERHEFDFREDTQDYACFDGYRAAVGPTHLIAAMRCYVASKLGESVEVPEELSA